MPNKSIQDIFLDYDSKKKEIIAFRLGMEYDKKALDKLICFEDKHMQFVLLKHFKKGIKYRNMFEDFLQIRRDSERYLEYYQNILNKIKKLSEELVLGNSLEICILFTYLLYNGYLSSNGTNVFQSKDRVNVGGLFFVDVAKGNGVCLNYSEYLKDLLITCGYSAANIVNSVHIKERTGKAIAKLQLDSSATGKLSDALMLLEHFFNQINHAFTMIKEDGKYYIFDPANYLLFSVDNYMGGTILNGKGSARFNLQLSHVIGYTDVEQDLLCELICSDSFPLAYNKNDLLVYTDCNRHLLRINNGLIKDFIDDSKEDINKLANLRVRKLTKREMNKEK